MKRSLARHGDAESYASLGAMCAPGRRPGKAVLFGLVAVGLCLLVAVFAILGERRGRTPRATGGTVLANVAAAMKRFDERAFHLDAIRRGSADVPRIFAVSLPSDVAALDDVKARKSLFIRLVLPLALRANADLRLARTRLLVAKAAAEMGRGPSDADRRWLEGLADRYGTAPGDFDGLLRRVDVVPVSLVLAQAIEESGWGTSRFAIEGNALFGQRTWRGDRPGLRPADLEPETRVKVRAYPDLLSSVRSYIHNLNTHWAYRQFRWLRREARDSEAALAGPALVAGLTRYSEAGPDYVDRIRGLIRRNGLDAFDRAKLRQAPG